MELQPSTPIDRVYFSLYHNIILKKKNEFTKMPLNNMGIITLFAVLTDLQLVTVCRVNL